MHKFILPFLLFSFTAGVALAQRPKSGTYTYRVAYWEWGTKPRDMTCEVIIRGDSVLVLSSGKGDYAGEKGAPIDGGRLMYHKKSGKWIIGHNPQARFAPRVGGCEEGPTVIDFKRRQVWLC